METLASVISALVVVILALVYFVRGKKNGHNPGNPNGNAQIARDHEKIIGQNNLTHEKMDTIIDELREIKDALNR